MKRIAGWFRRNNTIMAQAKDLSRQLQEAWEVSAGYKEGYDERGKSCDYLQDQLHRVTRERDNERKMRMEAEDRLLDYHPDGPTEEELGDWKAAYYNICDQLNRVTRERFQERKLRLEAEKLRDVYLEQLENEEE